MRQATDTGRDALAADGTVVHLRPIEPADADALVRFHGRLSPDTTYYRFFSPHPRLSDAEVTRFTTVDHTRREALVATFEGEIIGVARFDTTDDPGDAEVAFVVEDPWQGRGIGTLLMEHLTERARAVGLTRFVADTFAHNRRMLGLFRDSGLQKGRSFDGDVMHVDLPLAVTDAERAAVEHREHVAERHSIEHLLEPRSIAVIGADATATGAVVLEKLLSGRYAGQVYAVADDSLTRLPYGVDLAILAVPGDAVARVTAECAAKGAHAVVVLSAVAGYGRLLSAAHEHGLRVLGPHSLGIANTAIGLDATALPGRLGRGGLALLVQAGPAGAALLDRALRDGIGVSSFASVGDKADVSGNDLLQYWEDDPATTAIALHLDSLLDPAKFARLAGRVAATKPVIVTGDATGRELCARLGLLRAGSTDELFALARRHV